MSVKSSLSLSNEKTSCVSKSKSWTLWPKSLAEIHIRTATEMSFKTKKEKRRLTRVSSEDVAPSSSCLSFSCYTHTDYLHIDLKEFCSCWCLFRPGPSVLHGLSTQQVPRQQRVDWCGTPHDPSLLSTRGSPQVRILLHATPKQLPACLCSASQATAAVVVVVPVGRVTDGMRGSGPSPTHPCLIGAWSGLPAGCYAERLALCKEAVHFLLPSKLCQDGGVPEHAPRKWWEGEQQINKSWKSQNPNLRQCIGGHTCAGTSEPWQPHPWSCSAPQRCPVLGWGGMWWGGRAACTVYAESNHQSEKQGSYHSVTEAVENA